MASLFLFKDSQRYPKSLSLKLKNGESDRSYIISEASGS